MIVLGRIAAPYGIRGWVKVQAYGDDPGAWCSLQNWWLSGSGDPSAKDWRATVLEEAKPYGKGLVAKFAAIDDRDAALALGGLYLGTPRGALPANSKDEYYWADLIGLDVVNQAGESLGVVRSLLESGANAVLCVGEGKEERLLPFVAQVVREVDVAGRVIRVDWGRDW